MGPLVILCQIQECFTAFKRVENTARSSDELRGVWKCNETFECLISSQLKEKPQRYKIVKIHANEDRIIIKTIITDPISFVLT